MVSVETVALVRKQIMYGLCRDCSSSQETDYVWSL
jgi:hypothetical protein